jgi:hypothetical protein
VIDAYFKHMLTGTAIDFNSLNGLDGVAALKELYYESSSSTQMKLRLTFEAPKFLNVGDVGAGY